MLQFDRYECPETAEAAMELLQKKGSFVLGGGCWLRLGSARRRCAVDIRRFVSDCVEETEDTFQIGGLCTLRTLELHESLNRFFSDAPRNCVRDIAGVQFRNLATVGGSLWGRFGFSDVLTLMEALDAEAELVRAGRMPVTAFAEMPRSEKDILLSVRIPKKPVRAAICAERRTANDFPMLTCALAADEKGQARVAVGARPAAACCITLPLGPELPQLAAEQFSFGSNTLASAEYRRILCEVLLKRCMQAIGEGGAC